MTSTSTSVSSLTSARVSLRSARRVLARYVLPKRTLKDKILPHFVTTYLPPGIGTIGGVVVVQFVAWSLWLPVWACTWLMGEVGIYLGFLLLVFLIGRTILRSIAFPGASRNTQLHKQVGKHMHNSIVQCLDLWETVIRDVEAHGQSRTMSTAVRFRQRILRGMIQILESALQKNCTIDRVSGGITAHGTNQWAGDGGSLEDVSVRFVSTIYQQHWRSSHYVFPLAFSSSSY